MSLLFPVLGPRPLRTTQICCLYPVTRTPYYFVYLFPVFVSRSVSPSSHVPDRPVRLVQLKLSFTIPIGSLPKFDPTLQRKDFLERLPPNLLPIIPLFSPPSYTLIFDNVVKPGIYTPELNPLSVVFTSLRIRKYRTTPKRLEEPENQTTEDNKNLLKIHDREVF